MLLAQQFTKRTYKPGEVVVEQNTTGEDVYLVEQGAIEVYVDGLDDERLLVMLGEGQVFGEMALIGHGYRSASGRGGKQGCTLHILQAPAFNTLCDENTQIGYRVMRNLSVDLSIKLRHRNLTGM